LLVVEKASVEEKGNRPLMTRRSNVTHSSFASGAVPSVKASVWYANAMGGRWRSVRQIEKGGGVTGPDGLGQRGLDSGQDT
jgi:hypothetical protein